MTNTAVMVEHRNGVQQRIYKKTNRQCLLIVTITHFTWSCRWTRQRNGFFFGIINSLYNFFSRSTQRWEKLKDAVQLILKAEAETRWSFKTEAVKPIELYLEKKVLLLENKIEDDRQTIDTQSDGQQILNRILAYNFTTLIGFWKRLLILIDRVQKRLQDKTMNFHNAVLDLKGLRNHFNNEKERIVDKCLENEKMLCGKWGIEF